MSKGEISFPDVPEDDGLLFGCVLDGQGGARLINWEGIGAWTAQDGPLWLHLERNSDRVHSWLRNESGLTESTINALLADETRPRVFRGKRGLVAILRGVNTNPGKNPADMVTMRFWSEGVRVITLRQRRLQTARDLLTELTETRNGPKTAAQLFERLIGRLTERLAATVTSFNDKLDVLEESFTLSNATAARRQLSDLRHDVVALRRYLSPQREALNSLLMEPPAWLDDQSRLNLRETTDRTLRYVEELDAVRERSMVIKDDIANQLSESSNRTLYVLAIISGIFLPLAFLTGLLGINIGGMPGTENPYAFWIFCALMAALLVIELLIFRKLKWL